MNHSTTDFIPCESCGKPRPMDIYRCKYCRKVFWESKEAYIAYYKSQHPNATESEVMDEIRMHNNARNQQHLDDPELKGEKFPVLLTVLGWLELIGGILGIFQILVGLVLLFTLAGEMLGIGIFFGIIGFFMILGSLLSVIGGWGLIKRKRWLPMYTLIRFLVFIGIQVWLFKDMTSEDLVFYALVDLFILILLYFIFDRKRFFVY